MFNIVVTYITLLVVTFGLVTATAIVAFRQGEAAGLKKVNKATQPATQDNYQARAA